MSQFSVTVLLTLLDDEYYLPEWIECVRRIRPEEVLVVDGGSADNGPELLASQGFPGFQLVRRSMREIDWHYSRQLNFAASHARGDWILLIDADEVLWPPERFAIDRAIGEAGPNVDLFWLARFQLWPNERMRLDWGSHYDEQPRLWRRDAGLIWIRKVHSIPTLEGRIVDAEHPRTELVAEPVILHRKLTAPRSFQLARHRRWQENWAEASAEAGLPLPGELPEDYGPSLPLPEKVARWREDLVGHNTAPRGGADNEKVVTRKGSAT